MKVSDEHRFYQFAAQLGLSRATATTYWHLIEQRFLPSFRKLAAYTDEREPLQVPERAFQKRPFQDDRLNAWLVKAAIQKTAHGPLANWRFTVKDNVAVAGLPMQLGTHLMAGFRPAEDATVVQRLLAAGACLTGKAVSENLFCAGSSFTADTGAVANPSAPGYSAGGSSSGAAALVADGQVDVALGCDQTGSIRIPAAWCGVYGYLPSRGLVPYTGIVSVDPLLDGVGPLARDVATLTKTLDVIAGRDGQDPRQTPTNPEKTAFNRHLNPDLSELTIGIVAEGFQLGVSEPAVDQAVLAEIGQLKRAGAAVKRITLPAMRLGRTLADVLNTVSTYRQLVLNGGAPAGQAGSYPNDVTDALRQRIQPDQYAELAPIVQAIVYSGWLTSTDPTMNYYNRAQNLIATLRAKVATAFEACDLLALPTVPFRAPRLPQPDAPLTTQVTAAMGMDVNTGIWNVLGLPAISIPCAVPAGTRPVGLMLVGPAMADQRVLNAAYAHELVRAAPLED
ncbi:amidase family protein [Lactiplantibacillus modestisalitolerans]|uniref:Amidase family protein n=1 Tax=Lactiplantibacillus modestisalitolerans TaxID=1457219 RepID=A0ABV5WT85_9LACO|nr:amidase family protein [Lactiplantibacillus modestisalitolerans]